MDSPELFPSPRPSPRGSPPSRTEPDVPTITPLLPAESGFEVGDAVSLSTVLVAPTACIITMAQAYHPHMDIHYVENAHDLVVRGCTNQVIVLVSPSSKPGNGPREIADALRRLRQRGITRIYQPDDALVRYLGISDNRGGLVNALHRFEAGRLTGVWTAPVTQPTLDHYEGRSALRRK